MFQLLSCYSHNKLVLVVLIIMISLFCKTNSFPLCLPEIVCGNNVLMGYPFWNIESYIGPGKQFACGYPGFSFNCSDSTGKPMLNISNDLYYIEDYQEQSLLIVNREFHEKACPRPRRNFTDPSKSFFVDKRSSYFRYFFNCTSKPPSKPYGFYEVLYQLRCLDYNDTMLNYAYPDYLIDSKILEWSWKNCEENIVVPVRRELSRNIDHNILQKGFLVGWNTPMRCHNCESSGGLCSYNDMEKRINCTYCPIGEGKPRYNDVVGYYCLNDSAPYGELSFGKHDKMVDGELRNNIMIGEFVSQQDLLNEILEQVNHRPDLMPSIVVHILKFLYYLYVGVFTGVGGLTVIILLLFVYLQCGKKRRETAAPNVDLFLENYGCLSLQRYTYKDIKKMTKSFKEKLGQGGYGSVFKGKLVDGRMVAVKVLINDPKKSTNGEEFINEVATIGRTNHVNIVALLGFCSSGSKRALVYEFMPNGSLEKFIYANETETTSVDTTNVVSTSTTSVTHQLGWEKLYQIALGITHGLEYLHRGCNTGRILHFDIKPHNILLDENFCPKVSDFGLAKLCPTRESTVSLLGGRGTIGYIAPEVYCRNFGGISYKSDVYSYGMMVLEMVGGRKNIDPFVGNTSEIYFPHWIYDHLKDQKEKIEDLLRFEDEFEEEMVRKMIMVGLWCIQTNPAHRPSMGRVADMLEGRIEDLQMPPKPIVDLSSLPPPATS